MCWYYLYTGVKLCLYVKLIQYVVQKCYSVETSETIAVFSNSLNACVKPTKHAKKCDISIIICFGANRRQLETIVSSGLFV